MKILFLVLLLLCIFHFNFGLKESATEKLQALKNFENWFFDKIDESFGIKKEDKDKLPKRKIKLGLIPGSTEAGVFATQDINENEELIKIPYNLILSRQRIIQATRLGSLLNSNSDVSLKEEEVLALYLVYIKYCAVGEANPWELWIRALPKTFNSVLYFTDEEVSLLVGSHLYEEAVTFRNKTQSRFKIIEKEFVLKYPEIFKCALSYVSWKWAISIVRSRKLHLIDENQQGFIAIIPYFDFFNHKSYQDDKYSWGYKAANKFFHVEAFVSTKKGEQLFQPYGQSSNGHLLLDYGFIEPNNPFDSVLVEHTYFGIDPQDVVHDWKLAKILEFREEKKSHLLLTRNGMSQELLQAASIANCDVEDFDENGNMAKQPNIYSVLNLSRWFQAVAYSKLQKYETTIEEDQVLINSDKFNKLSKRAQMAIQVRLGEKEILLNIQKTFAERMKRILDSVKEVEKDEL